MKLTRIFFSCSHSLISPSLTFFFSETFHSFRQLLGLQFSDVATISVTLASYYLFTFQQNKCRVLIIFTPYVSDIIHQYLKETSCHHIPQLKSSPVRRREQEPCSDDPICYSFGGRSVRGDLCCIFPCLVWFYGADSLCSGVTQY